MDASTIPKLQSKEVNSDGRPVNLPGVYVHRDTGKKFITSDGDEGIVQADALRSPVWKDAWERVSDVPSRVELLEIRKAQEAEEAKKESATAELPKGGETFVSKFEK